MTRRTNSRLAGFMFLFYIATAFPAMVLSNQATGSGNAAAQLASLVQHEARMRVSIVLSLICIFDALVLAVALYALTRDYDRDLALIALACRVTEGVMNAGSTVGAGTLLAVAKGTVGATAAETAGANAVAGLLLKSFAYSSIVGPTVFAAGSTLFAYLFLRARSIPVWLAWLGVLGSLLLVICLPLQLASLLKGPFTQLMWIPVALFEIILGIWLLVKGVAAEPAR